ncbi:FHA domain-containing protein [Corallococcus sp. H22C18031201]|nr:FHA domain-containing protein [Corallococcus sp. H22C18031201]
MNRIRQTIEIAEPLWRALESMSRDLGVEPNALVAQALFQLARQNGYVAPTVVALSGQESAPVPATRAPVTVVPAVGVVAVTPAPLVAVSGADLGSRAEAGAALVEPASEASEAVAAKGTSEPAPGAPQGTESPKPEPLSADAVARVVDRVREVIADVDATAEPAADNSVGAAAEAAGDDSDDASDEDSGGDADASDEGAEDSDASDDDSDEASDDDADGDSDAASDEDAGNEGADAASVKAGGARASRVDASGAEADSGAADVDGGEEDAGSSEDDAPLDEEEEDSTGEVDLVAELGLDDGSESPTDARDSSRAVAASAARARPESSKSGAAKAPARRTSDTAPRVPREDATNIVTAPSAVEVFVRLATGEPVEVSTGRFTIGRGPQCGLVVKSERVSREHAAITRDGDDVFIEDLNSSNGTWYKSLRIKRQKIVDGDTFMLGSEAVVFSLRPRED